MITRVLSQQQINFFRVMTAWNLRYAFTVSAQKRRVKKLRASIVQVGGCGQTESFSFEQHHCGVVLHDVSDGRRAGGSVSLTVSRSLSFAVTVGSAAVKRRSAGADCQVAGC